MNVTYDLNLQKDLVENIHFEEKDYIKSSASNKKPSWFKELTTYAFNSRNPAGAAFRFLYYKIKDVQTLKTAKGCPAFINFFNQSIAITTSSDIFLKVYKDSNTGAYAFDYIQTDPLLSIESHGPDQIGAISNRVLVLKFSLPIHWVTDENCQFQYTDPHIYNDVPFKVCPGIIKQDKSTVCYFNMPTFFHKMEAEYHIKAGTVLGYIQFDKPVKSFFRGDLRELSKKELYKKHVKGDNKHLIGK